jgi:hypothetical protein
MKSLVFCTSWADNKDAWVFRYGKWLQHIRNSSLHRDQILLVDDGSPLMPCFEGVTLLDADALPSECPDAPVVLVRFGEHLGRRSVLDYPGWYRSFMFVAGYATRYGFDKIVHIESDTYILSQALLDHINSLQHGWTAFWSPRWNLPETCIQVICADHLPRYREVATRPYGSFTGNPIERLLPFTHVEKGFKGDRYGEFRSDLPLDADYSSQVPVHVPVWSCVPPAPRRVLALTLGEAAVPPHNAIYLHDAWQWASHACRHAAELLQTLEQMPAAGTDALQITLPGMQPGLLLPFSAMRRVLSQDGELLLNIRQSPGHTAAGALAQGLLGYGFTGMRLESAAASGDWIMAISDSTSLARQLVEKRIARRLRLVANLPANRARRNI